MSSSRFLITPYASFPERKVPLGGFEIRLHPFFLGDAILGFDGKEYRSEVHKVVIAVIKRLHSLFEAGVLC